MKTIFPKKSYLQQILTIFPNLKFFWFLQKHSLQVEKKTFSWNNIIWYPFFSKFATFKRVWKKVFFSKETHLFFQKKTNFTRFEKSYYFSRILRQICFNLASKNFQRQNSRTSDIFNCKQHKETFALRGWFSSHIININMAKNNSTRKWVLYLIDSRDSNLRPRLNSTRTESTWRKGDCTWTSEQCKLHIETLIWLPIASRNSGKLRRIFRQPKVWWKRFFPFT